jgi:hypothetical protein
VSTNNTRTAVATQEARILSSRTTALVESSAQELARVNRAAQDFAASKQPEAAAQEVARRSREAAAKWRDIAIRAQETAAAWEAAAAEAEQGEQLQRPARNRREA